MYTRNTDKKTGKFVNVTLSCNEAGCKQHIGGINNRDAWQQSRKLGWITPNAAQAFCPDHRKLYVVREGKAVLKSTLPAKSVTKSAVAKTKADKASKAGKAGKAVPAGKATPVAKSAPAKSAPTTFSGGQSIGKAARSAKSAK